jgi:hypothetical protein
MDLDLNLCSTRNAFTAEGKPTFLSFEHPMPAFVALGESASAWLGSIKHFKLPHPSSLNRKLNDKQEISRLLYRCKKFIYK